MSQKIGVLAHNQPLTAKASNHVRRDIAVLLVSRLVAEQITQKLIRMFPPDTEFRTLAAYQVNPTPTTYIPEKMPPREVPGVFFQEPQSPTWRRDHKTVTFLQRAQGQVYENVASVLNSRAIKPGTCASDGWDRWDG